jgi:hypothetical protein
VDQRARARRRTCTEGVIRTCLKSLDRFRWQRVWRKSWGRRGSGLINCCGISE